MLTVYLIVNFVTVLAKEVCIVDDKHSKIASGAPPLSFSVVYCDPIYQECCDEGCCDTQDRARSSMSPFVWFLLALIIAGYIYFCVRYFVKKFCKKRHIPVPQPQELNLMLSFNPDRNDLERFNFENLNNAHIHVPFVPTTPVTPPPAYVTLTPPPTYNVAILFPSTHKKQSEVQRENNSEIKSL